MEEPLSILVELSTPTPAFEIFKIGFEIRDALGFVVSLRSLS
jgi:hypothetical protein